MFQENADILDDINTKLQQCQISEDKSRDVIVIFEPDFRVGYCKSYSEIFREITASKLYYKKPDNERSPGNSGRVITIGGKLAVTGELETLINTFMDKCYVIYRLGPRVLIEDGRVVPSPMELYDITTCKAMLRGAFLPGNKRDFFAEKRASEKAEKARQEAERKEAERRHAEAQARWSASERERLRRRTKEERESEYARYRDRQEPPPEERQSGKRRGEEFMGRCSRYRSSAGQCDNYENENCDWQKFWSNDCSKIGRAKRRYSLKHHPDHSPPDKRSEAMVTMRDINNKFDELIKNCIRT